MNLYQMTEQFQNQIALFLETEGMDEDELSAWLNENIEELNNKRLSMAAYIKNLTLDYNQLIITYAAMKDRADSMAQKIERLKKSLLFSMLRTGSNVVTGIEFDIKVKKNPPKVIIENEALIPSGWKRRVEKIEYVPDKELIKKSIESGNDVPGACLLKEQRIEIK